jgi:hypothetical protein
MPTARNPSALDRLMNGRDHHAEDRAGHDQLAAPCARRRRREARRQRGKDAEHGNAHACRLARRQRLDAEDAADQHGLQRQGRQREARARSSRVGDREIVEDEEQPEEAEPDRRWNLLQANEGAVRLVEFLVGPLDPGAKINLADALVAPDVLRPYLTNWPDVVRYFIRSVEADAMADGTAETAALLERLIRYKGVSAVLRTRAADLAAATAGPVLPMRFRKGAIALELFTTIATLGTL